MHSGNNNGLANELCMLSCAHSLFAMMWAVIICMGAWEEVWPAEIKWWHLSQMSHALSAHSLLAMMWALLGGNTMRNGVL